MKRYMLITALAGTLALLGCSTGPTRYIKAGGGEEELQRTLARCRVTAAMVPEQGAWGALAVSNVRENCMRGEGWVRDPPCDPHWRLCWFGRLNSIA